MSDRTGEGYFQLLLLIKFNHQVLMGQYMADFLYSSFHLVMELDGNQHQKPEQVEYDKKRTFYFE
jgi:very-short-patch-repair endonuclease